MEKLTSQDCKCMDKYDSEESKYNYLFRSLFNDTTGLSPILEHQQPASLSSSPVRSESDSSLPDLIIEREANKHDESQEFYNELEVRMKKLYKKIFLKEDVDIGDIDEELLHGSGFCKYLSKAVDDDEEDKDDDSGSTEHIMESEIEDFKENSIIEISSNDASEEESSLISSKNSRKSEITEVLRDKTNVTECGSSERKDQAGLAGIEERQHSLSTVYEDSQEWREAHFTTSACAIANTGDEDDNKNAASESADSLSLSKTSKESSDNNFTILTTRATVHAAEDVDKVIEISSNDASKEESSLISSKNSRKSEITEVLRDKTNVTECGSSERKDQAGLAGIEERRCQHSLSTVYEDSQEGREAHFTTSACAIANTGDEGDNKNAASESADSLSLSKTSKESSENNFTILTTRATVHAAEDVDKERQSKPRAVEENEERQVEAMRKGVHYRNINESWNERERLHTEITGTKRSSLDLNIGQISMERCEELAVNTPTSMDFEYCEQSVNISSPLPEKSIVLPFKRSSAELLQRNDIKKKKTDIQRGIDNSNETQTENSVKKAKTEDKDKQVALNTVNVEQQTHVIITQDMHSQTNVEQRDASVQTTEVEHVTLRNVLTQTQVIIGQDVHTQTDIEHTHASAQKEGDDKYVIVRNASTQTPRAETIEDSTQTGYSFDYFTFRRVNYFFFF